MVTLKECIPSVASLLRRSATRKDAVQPSDAAKTEIARQLEKFGYTDENPAVFRAIVHYGAMMLEGINEKGLFLKGPVGIGKSYGVECLSVCFQIPVMTPLLLASVWKKLDGNLLDLEEFVVNGGDFFHHPHDIVLDELGTKDVSRNYGETAEIMADVLDMRYRAFIRDGVKTIVTTNLSDDEIATRYGLRIDDRMNEMFYFRSVTGRSLRRKE
ncbi:hypothetical protein [uncultured Victivallis sp.]|uniref:hypothetical protein n=1 Tax=uncultured Victivallis sp. TaxID=354118 RepID=UPI002599F064|nr:hypothetical protein [uncultured Victivallis sp.]